MNEFLWDLEVFVLVGSIAAAFFYIKNRYAPLMNVWPKEHKGVTLFVLNISPILSIFIIFFALLTLAAPDVVNDTFYILFYFAMGLALLMNVFQCPGEISLTEITWLEKFEPNTMIIMDLPGKSGLLEGLALSHFGYRPIPLYNSAYRSQMFVKL